MRKSKKKPAVFEERIDRRELEKAFDMFPEIIRQKKIQARYKKRIMKNFEAFSKDLAKRIKDP